MMYNQGLPMGYNPMGMQQNYQYPYPQQLQNMQQLNQQQMPQNNNAANSQQIQHSGFVSVRNIEEAKQWPVAPGNSITFKIEGIPYVCEKTMGFSQLESPRFEIFKLVKENYTAEASENAVQPKEESEEKPNNYVLGEDFDVLTRRVAELEGELKETQQKVASFDFDCNEKSNEKGNYNAKSGSRKSEVKKDE